MTRERQEDLIRRALRDPEFHKEPEVFHCACGARRLRAEEQQPCQLCAAVNTALGQPGAVSPPVAGPQGTVMWLMDPVEPLKMVEDNFRREADRDWKRHWMQKIFDEVQREREEQDKQWGGPRVDDTRSSRDWVAFIVRHLAGAVLADNARLPEDGGRFRRAMVKVAALAVAAIEAYDRAVAVAAAAEQARAEGRDAWR